MKRLDRQQDILDLLKASEPRGIVEMATLLSVSDETIRRELRKMEVDGLAERLHGGARLKRSSEEGPFTTRLNRNSEAKKRIAAAVAAAIPDGQSCYIDASSTSYYISQALRERRDLTIVTNALGVANELAGRNGNRLFLAGGEYDYGYNAAFGHVASDYLARFTPDIAIVSTESVDPIVGLTNYNVDEAAICRQMISQSARCFVAVDAQKFGRRSVTHVLSFSEIDMLFTDAQPDENYRAALSLVDVTIC